MIVITFLNRKGGVGKTSSCVMLSEVLARHNQKVLLLDLDAQENLSTSNGYNGRDDLKGSYEFFMDDNIFESIQSTENKNIDIVIANEKTDEINNQLLEENFKIKYKIDELLFNVPTSKLLVEKFKQLSEYDYILIDCPATMNEMIKSALNISDIVLVPINADEFSIEGIIKLMNKVEAIKLNDNDNLQLSIFMNKYRPHLRSHKEAYELLRNELPNYMSESTITERKDIQSNVENSKDIFKLKNKKAVEIVNQYISLFNEVKKNVVRK